MEQADSYDTFRTIWVDDVLNGTSNNLAKGRRFASKLICQWLDLDEDDPAISLCDGSRDGGIDIAVLDNEGQTYEGDNETGFDRWLLVQLKYGAAFRGPRTILDEGRKVLDTLRGYNTRLSSLSSDILDRLYQFRRDAGPYDRLVLVYATIDEMSAKELNYVKRIEEEGRKELGEIFTTETVSLRTIFEREIGGERVSPKIKIESKMRDLTTISSIKISNYFSFLENYRDATMDIDQIFERNVRKFLPRSKINKRLMDTLKTNPSLFAIYNNGITLVCSSSYQASGNYHVLVNPYVVNGCQTTKTIWQVCTQKLRSGGRSTSEETSKWKRELLEAEIPIKIVKNRADDIKFLRDITRYTNTQNAIRESDFIALTDDFIQWASEWEMHYGLFLEIQRGGWEARQARQRVNSRNIVQLKVMARASDLLKVLGACWYRYPGIAFSKNGPFLPGGSVYREMSPPISSEAISAKDLLAAYRLQQAAQVRGFGRAAPKPSRRATKFLFYFITGELMRRLLGSQDVREQRTYLTEAVLKIYGNEEMSLRFFDGASAIIDKYLEPERKPSIFHENGYDQNLSNFLKADSFGRDASKLTHLYYHLEIQESMWREVGFWKDMSVVIEAKT